MKVFSLVYYSFRYFDVITRSVIHLQQNSHDLVTYILLKNKLEYLGPVAQRHDSDYRADKCLIDPLKFNESLSWVAKRVGSVNEPLASR